MRATCFARVALCSGALALFSCAGIGNYGGSSEGAPKVPPPGTGAGSGAPIAIEFVAPDRVFNIGPSEMLAARRLAEAEKQRRELEAQLKKEGRYDEVFPLRNRELRQLNDVILGGRKLEHDVDLVLRVTNTSPKTLSVHFGPDFSRVDLHVDGPGAAFIPWTGMHTADLKVPPETRIRPGGSGDFRVKKLHGGERNADRWLLTSPGRYTARLRFTGKIATDEAGAGGDLVRRLEEGVPYDRTTNEITFNVTSRGR